MTKSSSAPMCTIASLWIILTLQMFSVTHAIHIGNAFQVMKNSNNNNDGRGLRRQQRQRNILRAAENAGTVRATASVTQQNNTRVGGGVDADSNCIVIPVTFYRTDVEAGFQSYALGNILNSVPFYHSETGAQLGTYSDVAVNYATSDDCNVNGAFSFLPLSTDELYPSQINMMFTCNSESNAIAGGSGAYGCAHGYEYFVFIGDDELQSQISLCTELCPY